MQQEVVLTMLAKEPSHGYQLRARLRDALGPLGDAMNPGHVYVTLTRLEKAGLVPHGNGGVTGQIAPRTRPRADPPAVLAWQVGQEPAPERSGPPPGSTRVNRPAMRPSSSSRRSASGRGLCCGLRPPSGLGCPHDTG
jgi:hypothetical protein